MGLLAQPPFRADAEAVADDQHADHQFRIDRRSAYGAVQRLQLPPQPVEFEHEKATDDQIAERISALTPASAISRVGGALARGGISQLAARSVIPDNCLMVTGVTGILKR
jgi:hypothetical protein